MDEKDVALNTKRDEFLPFFLDHLPDDFRRKAQEELNETDANITKGLKELTEMIKSEETLKDIQFHTDMMQMFLRHSKYDAKKAFNRLRKYISFKRKHGFIFEAIPDELFEKYESQRFFNILPMRSSDGCAIVTLEYGKWDPDEIPWADFERIPMSILQISMRDPMTQISGFKCIHDWKNMSFKAFRQFTPFNAYQACQAFWECLPARYKEIHVVNQPSIFKVIWAIVKPLLSEKMKRRVVFHSRPEDLLDYFPRSVIPEQYGGDLKDDDHRKAMTDWLRKNNEQQKQCTIGGHCNYY